MSEVKPLSRSEREAKIKDKAGFIIVILAALLAINTMIGGSNSSKIMNNTIAANNQWAWYQAKNVRQVLYETAAVESKIPSNKEKFEAEAKRMEADKKEIMGMLSGSILQIAIVLLTASILAVSMPMFWVSVVVGSAGSLFVSQALWMWLPFTL